MKRLIVFTAVVIVWLGAFALHADNHKEPEKKTAPSGVCPPFFLKDEAGNIIDPVHNINTDKPYSPKQTCGTNGCHDYDKITEGFHFTQGKGEKVPDLFANRYNWVTSPGNYGGTWCSPAPLYRQLAAKKNDNARMIDMTSFDFVTATCGNCHPGGGPLEYDREGNRYDEYMKKQGMKSGEDNGLDGDYFKARWIDTGVIEADCLLCHMPEYNFKERNKQLANLNFKWAATAGSGFGNVDGSIKDSKPVKVIYDKNKFDEEGKVIVHIAPEPRNETCLQCHKKPDWKKRGAAFSPRTDVHIAAGLRCVDCHASGSKAVDKRIRDKEAHQFGKGDDPSGWVRNDLDNTMRTCEDCHRKGWRNAPKATHSWLPPLHMEKLSCQACHIPSRAVKSALVQASDIYNPAPRITPPPKHIWTFYDQEMNFWNHYGELDLFTAMDQPTDVTRPTLFRYKGKIYPGNRVHSSWVGFEEDGKKGLNQLFMKDFFQMWIQHNTDPEKNYPELSFITDDNNDGVVEVNRPEEIDALLTSVKNYLNNTGFPLDGKRLVWLSGSRAYYSSRESHELPRQDHEATAYASVYKFSHDIAPAKAALGAGGCTDCHRSGAPFFEGNVLKEMFSAKDGKPVWMPNHELLGISHFWIRLGAFREAFLKPILFVIAGLLVILTILAFLLELAIKNGILSPQRARLLTWVAIAGVMVFLLIASLSPGMLEYMTFSRFSLDANHFWITVIIFLISFGALLSAKRDTDAFGVTMRTVTWIFVMTGALSGLLMLIKIGGLSSVTRFAYTAFDVSLVLIALSSAMIVIMRIGSDRSMKR
ncbi:MAG: hypothetical protein QXT73_03370 [Candidatus Methanomethylicaceae archaeon]